MNRGSSVVDIVVVDDDIMIVALVKRRLKNSEYSYLCFSDPNEAMLYFSASSAKILIIDYMMPKMDGLALIEKIRATPNYGNSVIYLCSAVELPGEILRIAKEYDVIPLLKDQLLEIGFFEGLDAEQD